MTNLRKKAKRIELEKAIEELHLEADHFIRCTDLDSNLPAHLQIMFHRIDGILNELVKVIYDD